MGTARPGTHRIAQVPVNALGRDFVVGDVHGCFRTLDTALTAIGFDSRTDRLFGVGDLVNRGPHSEEALGWLERRFETVVLGNHDRSVLSWFKAKRGSPPPRFSPPPESEWLLGHPLQLAHQMFETAETLGVCLVPGRQNLVLGKQRFDYRSHRSRPGW